MLSVALHVAFPARAELQLRQCYTTAPNTSKSAPEPGICTCGSSSTDEFVAISDVYRSRFFFLRLLLTPPSIVIILHQKHKDATCGL